MKRRAQPGDPIDKNGRLLNLGVEVLNGTAIDARQQCTAEDCPLKGGRPHAVGLYSNSRLSFKCETA